LKERVPLFFEYFDPPLLAYSSSQVFADVKYALGSMLQAAFA
jgi:hypothetical protein